jgi:hypothetical protein
MDSNLRFLVARASWGTELLSRKRERICWGTEGSNPSPSSGESANLRSRFRDDAVRATASRFAGVKRPIVSGAVQLGIDFLKNEREQRKVRGDDPETTLFMGLRDVYVSLSGKTGISDDGPLHRFANACTKLIDVSIILPQPQSLRKALKRRGTPPPYFR